MAVACDYVSFGRSQRSSLLLPRVPLQHAIDDCHISAPDLTSQLLIPEIHHQLTETAWPLRRGTVAIDCCCTKSRIAAKRAERMKLAYLRSGPPTV